MNRRFPYDLNEIFSDLFVPQQSEWTYTVTTSELPATSQEDDRSDHKSTWTETGATVSVDVPGIKADSLDVSVSDGRLSIKYIRDEVKHEKKFVLSDSVVQEPVKAVLENGVLTLEFKKVVDGKKPHKVKIETK
jgi:HSP20 family molecular chaperone IbpA